MKKFVNYYRVLGLRPEADDGEIRQAYVRLAKEHHPDKGGSHDRMNLINDAYETLKNPLKRAEFDRRREALNKPISVQTESYDFQKYSSMPNKPRTRNLKLAFSLALLIFAIGAWFLVSDNDNTVSSNSSSVGLPAELQELRTKYDLCVEDFDQITNKLSQVNHDLNIAKSNSDNIGYNALIPVQNQTVNEYNAKRTECTNLKNQYNDQINNLNESAAS